MPTASPRLDLFVVPTISFRLLYGLLIMGGFAVLSGVLATVTRNWLTAASCARGLICDWGHRFADAVVAGDLPQALAGLTGASHALALEHARLAYSGGFAAALLVAAAVAGLSAVLVGTLMRKT